MNISCGSTPRLRLIWTVLAPALSAASMIRGVTSAGVPHGICSACRSTSATVRFAEILARELRSTLVFRADIVGRGRARIAGLALQFGLGEIAVTEQGAIEIEMVRTHFAHRL